MRENRARLSRDVHDTNQLKQKLKFVGLVKIVTKTSGRRRSVLNQEILENKVSIQLTRTEMYGLLRIMQWPPKDGGYSAITSMSIQRAKSPPPGRQCSMKVEELRFG